MKPKFNKVNDNISWAKWSWNPVTGCLHGCDYCYARTMAENPYFRKGFPNGFKPTFLQERLAAPKNHKIPASMEGEPGIRNVFLCSMADLWGDWVQAEWIKKTMSVISESPEYNFISLTKNPKRYLEFADILPGNIWIGATADTQIRFNVAMDAFKELNVSNIKFISCEPLTEKIEFDDSHIGLVDWVIIGALKRSEHSNRQPDVSWVENLILFSKKSDAKVYLKPNLTVVSNDLKQFPSM